MNRGLAALPRVLEPETLDHLAPDDPVAQRSRRDLRRVNAFMGARGILERALMRVVPDDRGGRPLRIVELGCGDGRLMLDVARRRGKRWPAVTLDLLDRQPIVEAATIAAYAEAGWQARPMVADVIDWAAKLEAGERWDVVVANLFLHHFDGDALRRVLVGCAARADALVACEPRRSRFALGASHLIFFLGANAVTRRDGVLSVRAGFVDRDLSAAWPGAAGAWRIDEYDDGLFTHCFCAARAPGPAG
ncbi:MAG: methyltransferase domain-containing protein [Caldimonas sp.]